MPTAIEVSFRSQAVAIFGVSLRDLGSDPATDPYTDMVFVSNSLHAWFRGPFTPRVVVAVAPVGSGREVTVSAVYYVADSVVSVVLSRVASSILRSLLQRYISPFIVIP